MVVDISDGVVDVLVRDFISGWLWKVFDYFVDWYIGEILDFFRISCFKRTSVLRGDGA